MREIRLSALNQSIFFVAFLALLYLKKNAGIKINFLCNLLFYEFLMYFFVFWPFVFVFVFGEICGRHFLKHNKFISAIESKNKHIYMNYVKKLNLHWFCTQNHILEPFSVRRACTKSYVTSEPYPRASQIWSQNVRETWKKKVIKCRGESFARCRVIAPNVEGGLLGPPPPVFLVLNYSWLW